MLERNGSSRGGGGVGGGGGGVGWGVEVRFARISLPFPLFAPVTQATWLHDSLTMNV